VHDLTRAPLCTRRQRNSDVEECQWLLELHTFGLVNNSFQPTDEIRIARFCGGNEAIWWPMPAAPSNGYGKS
jgi:hypothetical protein